MQRIRTLGASLGASLLATVAGAGFASAADLSQPSYNPPPQAYSPAPAWSWTGPYAGLTGGYGWANTSGFIGGAYAGYNLQTNRNLVVGFEGDVTATSKSTNPWDATFRGRLGYAWDRFILYGTAGVAVGGLNGAGASSTSVGWVGGVGLEAALTDKVTGRIEYRHTDLGTLPGAGGTSSASNDFLVGVGFKF